VRYLRAFQYPFDSPNWLANVGFVTVCLLSTAIIPIVGAMLIIGYLFEVVEAMHRQRDDRTYPDFRWERFVEYLVRGAQVFLVQFAVGLLECVVYGVAVVIAIIAVLATMTDESNLVVLIAVIVGLVLMALVLGVLMSIVVVPLTLRIGLTQDLGNTFSWSFIKDYARRMAWPTVGAELVLLIGSVVLQIVGLAMCFVGVYPAAALTMFARFHIYYQLYELYLERGGMTIPLKGELRPWPGVEMPSGS
jgi:hypothetical protein